MPDSRYLELLSTSKSQWNALRILELDKSPDLSKAFLASADLTGFWLNGVNLTLASLKGANLCRGELSNAILRGANLAEANLSDALLRYADCREVEYERGTLFDNADLSYSALTGANLTRASFLNANLFNSTIDNVILRQASLKGANLTQALLRDSTLTGANLTNANLTNARLQGADLSYARLNGADLSGTDLTGVNLTGADLTGAKFDHAIIGWTIFGTLDLRTVKGLETVEHKGPSEISTSTLSRSSGEIPEIFLRGVGLDETFISYVRSLTNNPIEYYTCFISYSNMDQKFAERLHADLQQKGVLCWFAPHDMRIGDKIRPRIDESIRLYDKLLLILSEHSVKSQWVEHEVETAIGKELEGISNVLFPIRLDDTVMESKTGWASHIKLTRHIGDFTHWKDHDTYLKSLQRLIQDLKEDSSKPAL